MKVLVVLILCLVGTGFFYIHRQQQEQLAALKAGPVPTIVTSAPVTTAAPASVPPSVPPVTAAAINPAREVTSPSPVIHSIRELLTTIKSRCLLDAHAKGGSVVIPPNQPVAFACCPIHPAVHQSQVNEGNSVVHYTCEPEMGTLTGITAYNKEGRWDGVWKRYSSLGMLLTEDTFSNGHSEGVSRKYYDIVATDKGDLIAGQLYAEIPREGNLKHGTSKYYYPNGRLFAMGTFSHGKLRTGSMEYFAPDGTSLNEKSAWKLNPSMPQQPDTSSQ